MQYISGQHIFNTIYLSSWSQVLGSTSPHIAEREFSILLHGTIQFYAFKYPGRDGSDVQLENFPYYRGEAGIQSTTGSGAIPSTHSPIFSQYAGKFFQPGKQELLLEHGFMDGFYFWTNPLILFRAGQTHSWGGYLSTCGVSAIKQDFQRCVKSRVTLKT